MLASASWDGTIRLCEVYTGSLERTLEGHKNGVESVTFSPDGMTLASASNDHTIRLWDVDSGNRQRTIEGGCRILETIWL